mgnify:CR=1 FL=1
MHFECLILSCLLANGERHGASRRLVGWLVGCGGPVASAIPLTTLTANDFRQTVAAVRPILATSPGEGPT